MTIHVLLIGLKGIVVEDVRAKLNLPGIELFGGTNIEDVRDTMFAHPINHVIMGAGIELEWRLEIVREIFSLSDKTTVHLKDVESGPEGFLPFVHAVLLGLSGTATPDPEP